MSKTAVIKLNAQLSASFSGYVSKYPDVLKGVPKDACIVFTTTSNERLSRINEDIAKEVVKKEKKQCYIAKKNSRGWTVLKMA
ncbi:MAG: DUF5647 family protein [Patescibacteria group bacterium]